MPAVSYYYVISNHCLLREDSSQLLELYFRALGRNIFIGKCQIPQNFAEISHGPQILGWSSRTPQAYHISLVSPTSLGHCSGALFAIPTHPTFVIILQSLQRREMGLQFFKWKRSPFSLNSKVMMRNTQIWTLKILPNLEGTNF